MKSVKFFQARPRWMLVLSVAVFVVVAVMAVAILMHRSSNPGPSDTPSLAEEPTPSEPPEFVPAPGGALAPLPATADANSFARDVASAVFAWDTRTLATRAGHIDRLVAVSDPTGESSPGLVSDLDGYLPTQEMWVRLAQYETRQWLVIQSAATPETWAVAEAQAGDTLAPGTTAVTVRGVRHRAGVWEDEPVTSTHDVAFTVFVVCGPSYAQCHLLRLSMLDHPLE